jgi:hypothetical protein
MQPLENLIKPSLLLHNIILFYFIVFFYFTSMNALLYQYHEGAGIAQSV